MVTEDFQLEQIYELQDFLKELKKKATVVLLTNSDKEDVNRLLNELSLTGLFHDVITSAQKPTKTVEFFRQVMKKFHVVEEETLSIGDNYINEIAPALLLGMKAVYISEHPYATSHKNLLQFNRITSWIDQVKLKVF